MEQVPTVMHAFVFRKEELVYRVVRFCSFDVLFSAELGIWDDRFVFVFFCVCFSFQCMAVRIPCRFGVPS